MWIRIRSRRIPGRWWQPGAGIAGPAARAGSTYPGHFSALYECHRRAKSVGAGHNRQTASSRAIRQENSPRLGIRCRGRISFCVRQSERHLTISHKVSLPQSPLPRADPDLIRRFGRVERQKTKFKGWTEGASRTLIHGSCGAAPLPNNIPVARVQGDRVQGTAISIF
jgi:hypothetical protein